MSEEAEAALAAVFRGEWPRLVGAALRRSILDVIYLVFNEGYLPAAGQTVTRGYLASEARRLACLLTELLPGEPAPQALRALLSFQLSRWPTRSGPDGALLTLDAQDRTQWDRELIADGARALELARRGERGPLLLQAELAGCHSTAPTFAATDWDAILALYDELLAIQDTPVVALNRAVSVAMAAGPAAALPLLATVNLCRHAHHKPAHRGWFAQRRRVVYRSGVAADLELIGAVRAALREAAQPELARPMQAYMKSATPFLGVRVPMMRTLTRAEAKLRPFATSADLIDTVLRLWREAGYREERYAAITLLDTPAARRLRDPAVLQTLRELIVTGAWWDYVDELAHRVGDLLLSWPAEVRPALLTWTRSDDRWLRRASIICQLGTRDQADVELLTIAIESAIDDSDFFLRKAIGWALRDYARTDPAWVRSFAETHELSPLSRREALKHLS